ncbi:MAG: ABC transporter ATP-binding protein [Bacteroidales bacterium]|nr:ABC transporter ATP-binding protein [Bacteroidales bacterium]MDD4209310.1 ABC transporter ATP-binding protein [Bacteroidales bacterium]
MIQVEHIEKKYAKVNALQNISLHVNKGEIFGIIGPDGSGKTTLFRILSTVLLADKGKACINGWDVVKDYRIIRNHIGYMPGRFSLYQDLSVEENLQFFASIFKTSIESNYYLIKDIYQQLEPFKKRRAGALSGGMKQKLALCCALIHKPDLLFLDEPTTGVDPVSRKELWDMLKRLKSEGVTILVSTSYMDEAARCDRIALMMKGKFLIADTPSNIVNQYNEKLWAVSSDAMAKLLIDLKNYPFIKNYYAFGDLHHITMQANSKSDIELQHDLHEYLEKLKHQELFISNIKASIEDCFMALTGGSSDTLHTTKNYE